MNWHSARNLLCVRLDSMGDVLMTSPALRALKESVPGRRITLLTSRAGAAVARLVPEIDATLQFSAPWMKPCAEGPARDQALVRRLAQRQFDAAIVFTVYSQNPLPAAYLCYLAGIPLRLAHCRENPYQLLTDWVTEAEPQTLRRHEVQRQLDLVGVAGSRTDDERLSFMVPPAARRSASRRLHSVGIGSDLPLVVVHPGASAASRRYPPASFAAALNLLRQELDCEIVFTGEASEAPLVETIRAQVHGPSHGLAGRLTLSELGATIEQARVLLSNNTGPVHIAAALGTPVVDLYAMTNPQHTPWQVPSRVLFHDVACRWCHKSACVSGHHLCLRGVPPSQVARAVLDLLRETDVPAANPLHARPAAFAGIFGVPA